MAMTPVERQRRYRERRLAEIDKMPKIPCVCGCGELIPPINGQLKPARYKVGHFRDGGKATRFKPGNIEMARRGAEALRAQGRLEGAGHPNWRGGEYQDKRGYVRSTISAAQGVAWPTARKHTKSGGWVIPRSHKIWNLAHPDDVVVKGYEIHHVNGVTDDDRAGNLLKLTVDEHRTLHVAKGWHQGPRPGGRKAACKYGHPRELYRRQSKSGRSTWCTECERLKKQRYRAQARPQAA